MSMWTRCRNSLLVVTLVTFVASVIGEEQDLNPDDLFESPEEEMEKRIGETEEKLAGGSAEDAMMQEPEGGWPDFNAEPTQEMVRLPIASLRYGLLLLTRCPIVLL